MENTFKKFKRVIKLIALISPLLLGGVGLRAQFTYSICQDKPNNGQLKRMVFIKWDDWEPSTKTILGIPLNAKGYLFWKVLNKKYYEGEDRRPYRLAGGPFIKNYADLAIQEKSDIKIKDSTEKIRDTHLATYLNMSGGTADVAYNLFFKKKFEDIYHAFDEWTKGMQKESPKAYEACLNSPNFQKFIEYLDITKDRVNAVHESFVDKGVRLEAYINIYKELGDKYNVISHYMAGQVQLAKMPSQKELRAVSAPPTLNRDKDIVTHILSTFKF